MSDPNDLSPEAKRALAEAEARRAKAKETLWRLSALALSQLF